MSCLLSLGPAGELTKTPQTSFAIQLFKTADGRR